MGAITEFSHTFMIRLIVPEVQGRAFAQHAIPALRKSLLNLRGPTGKVIPEIFLRAVASDEVVLRKARVGVPPVPGISGLTWSMQGILWVADLATAAFSMAEATSRSRSTTKWTVVTPRERKSPRAQPNLSTFRLSRLPSESWRTVVCASSLLSLGHVIASRTF